MKLIPKKAQGGSFSSLFADFTAMAPPASMFDASSTSSDKTPSKTSSGDNTKGEITNKDLFGLVKDVDGLPNDMRVLGNNIQAMHRSASLFGSNEFSTSKLNNMFVQNAIIVKTANFNKKEFDKAYTEIEKNKGLNEVVFDGNKLVVFDGLNFKRITYDEYKQNKDKYNPLTASNILYIRANHQKYAFDNTLIELASHAIGMEKVTELIQNITDKIKTSETSQSGYISKSVKNGTEVIEGLKELTGYDKAAGLTVNGLYKAKIINKTLKEQANAALQYILQSLPEEAKALLNFKSDGKPLDLITQLVASGLSETHSVDFDLQANLNADGSKKSSKDGENESIDKLKTNTAFLFISGMGEQQQFIINPGTNVARAVSTTRMPIVKDGSPMEAGSTLQDLSSSVFGGILDLLHATMGNIRIDPNNLNHVFVETNDIYLVDFPVLEDGVTPDMRPQTLEKKKQASDMLKEAGINMDDPVSRKENVLQINQIMEECELPPAVDQNGNLGGRWRLFAVVNGVTHNKALGMEGLDSNAYLQEIDNEFEELNLLSRIKEINKLKKFEWDHKDPIGLFHWWEGDYDAFYKGTIWIPVSDDPHSALAGNATLMTPNVMQGLSDLQQIKNHLNEIYSQYVNPSLYDI